MYTSTTTWHVKRCQWETTVKSTACNHLRLIVPCSYRAIVVLPNVPWLFPWNVDLAHRRYRLARNWHTIVPVVATWPETLLIWEKRVVDRQRPTKEDNVDSWQSSNRAI